MYTISEFRKNLRQAFNDADQGHEVVIERWGQKYQLVSLVDKPLKGHAFVSKPGKEPELKKEYEKALDTTKGEKPPEFPASVDHLIQDEAPQLSPLLRNPLICKNGHPLADNGKCLWKGCKYAG